MVIIAQSNIPVQGKSLVPWMQELDKSPAVGPVYAQVSLRAVKTVQMISFMKDGWKLVVNFIPKESVEFYQISRDSHETRNILETEIKRANLLGADFSKFRKLLPKAKTKTVDLTDQEIKRLRSLGYIK